MDASKPLTNILFTDSRTPLEGLYLASAWGNSGGGYAGALMSGQLIFLKMMEDWGG